MMPGHRLALGNGTAKALGSPDFAFSIQWNETWATHQVGVYEGKPVLTAIISQGGPKEKSQAVSWVFLVTEWVKW